MHEPGSGKELDSTIADLRRRLAEVGSDEVTGLILDLADKLLERIRRAASHPDRNGVRRDLDEVSSRLEALLRQLDPGSPYYPSVTWLSGFAHDERWTECGDPADRDTAIRRLTEALGTGPHGMLPEPEMHATLAELHIQRATECEAGDPRGTEFDLAIGHARAGLRAQPPPEGLYLSLGVALWQRSLNDQRFVHADSDGRIQTARTCRAESIDALGRALAEHPDQDFLWALAAGALGCAHYNRYSDPWPGVSAPDPADLEAAIDLLPGALALVPDPLTAICLIEALANRARTSDRPGDLDLIITWGHYLLEDAQDLGADLNWVRELTGSALVDRAASGALTRDADLAAGIDQYEMALALAPPGDTDRMSLLKKLAEARWLAIDGDDSRYAAMDAMTTAADDAWAVLEPDNPDRALIGMYVAFGIDSRLRRPGGPPPSLPAIGHAIEVLSAIEPLLGHEPRSHLQVIILLGHFLVWRGQLTGDISEVSRAEPWILEATSQISLDDPDWRPFVQVLGMAMTILAHLGMNTEHLDQAITLLEDITGQPSSDAVVDAMLHGALGFLLAQRAGFTGRIDDLDQGISRMQRSYELAPPGHAYRAAVGANLGSSLAMRFIRSGQVEDVDAARFYLDAAAALTGQAGNEVRALMPDANVVIAANRGTLRALESLRGDTAALDDAVAELEAALVLAPAKHPYRSRIQCDLGFALALRGLSGRATVTDAREATRHTLAALADLGDGHPVRPMALLHASGALIAAAVTAKEKQPIRDAIAFTTRALGEVDPRFGERFRFVILLGAAAVALHRRTGDPADLETAIGWLEKGRLELAGSPSHPQFAYCLINLARAYHGRPDAGLAIETGLTALRARARDLLLQSGTERSLRLARLAAGEATEVASWCLAEGRPESAVEALELGRGLILHAATMVAALPELLIGIGRADLAVAWRESAAADRETPWDTVGQGQEYLAMLRAGPSPLDVPDDVRVRVFAALAGSPAEQRLLSPPTVAEMAGALAETGAHVLVYLVPPLKGGSGHAIIVRAADSRPANRAPAEIVSLRFLGADALEAYSQAHAAMSAEQTATEDPEATRSRVVRDWYQALGDLCEWAWSGAILPILSKLREWQVGQPPRLVLIAGSALSLVPWHAARSGSAEAGTVRYALQDAVFSYAASARQLVDAARRPPLALAESPVILGDPTGTLPQAVLEAQAIHDRCYPSGRYLGGTSSGWPGTVAGEGSPSQILRELPRADRPGASVLHLGCHSWVANSGPGQSHLVLAEGGKLPVDTILNQAKDRPVSAPGGLVSLAACRSDLAVAEYDEALTLSTAFLAAGAVTVVGSRWEIPDSATSLLMFMFHLRVARYGDSPRDALRLAQLWLLNPDREPPEEMPGELAQRARRLRLRDITAWAGFVHHGR